MSSNFFFSNCTFMKKGVSNFSFSDCALMRKGMLMTKTSPQAAHTVVLARMASVAPIVDAAGWVTRDVCWLLHVLANVNGQRVPLRDAITRGDNARAAPVVASCLEKKNVVRIAAVVRIASGPKLGHRILLLKWSPQLISRK